MDDGKVQSRDVGGVGVGGGVGGGSGSGGGDLRKPMSPSHDEALKKCFEENKGDHDKCKSQVKAFKYSSGSGGGGGGGGDLRKPMSPSHDEGLKKCLEENKGDNDKCKSQVKAFKYSSSSVPKKPLSPLSLRSGSLTDV